MNLIEALSKLSEIVDPALALRLCIEHGIEEIVLEPHPLGIPGSYRDGILYLDPGADRGRIVRTVKGRHGLTIDEADALTFVFLHELAHHVLRTDDQMSAERWALEKFTEWRMRR